MEIVKKLLGGRLLLIDDDNDIRNVLNFTLSSFTNCDIVEAANGAEALKVVASHAIDLIICDINMPIMNGIEFFRRFREGDTLTPVIFLTSVIDLKLEQDLLKLGAFDFISKPCTSLDLVILIEDALIAARAKKQNLKTDPSNVQGFATNVSPIVKSKLSPDHCRLLASHCRAISLSLARMPGLDFLVCLRNCQSNVTFLGYLAKTLHLQNLISLTHASESFFTEVLKQGKVPASKIEMMCETFRILADKYDAQIGDSELWDKLPEWQEILSIVTPA